MGKGAVGRCAIVLAVLASCGPRNNAPGREFFQAYQDAYRARDAERVWSFLCRDLQAKLVRVFKAFAYDPQGKLKPAWRQKLLQVTGMNPDTTDPETLAIKEFTWNRTPGDGDSSFQLRERDFYLHDESRFVEEQTFDSSVWLTVEQPSGLYEVRLLLEDGRTKLGGSLYRKWVGLGR